MANESQTTNSQGTNEAQTALPISPPPAPFSLNLVPHPAARVPVDASRDIRFGLFFLIVAFGGFSLWAGFAPISSALITSGEVVVNTYRKSIQHYEGGIIEDIYVRNGDKVAAGDPLVRIDAMQAHAKRTSNEKRLLTTQAELERLLAEQKFSDKLVFSDNLTLAAEQDPDVRAALLQQRELHSARRKTFIQEQEALKSRTEQIREEISGLRKQKDILAAQAESFQSERRAYTNLFKKGLGDDPRARELDRAALSTENEITRINSEISRLNIQITETELQVATKRQDYLKDVSETIRKIQDNYYDFQEIQQLTNDRIHRSMVRAPEAGVVVNMQIHTIGSVVGSGQTLLDLVPEHDDFVIEAKLMIQDINDVYEGQKVDIRFSAFDTRFTKVIEGEVVTLSADRLINERDQQPYYLVRIKVTEEGERNMTDSMKLKPGMPAEVMIRREDRTLYSYLIKPISDSFARGLKEK